MSSIFEIEIFWITLLLVPAIFVVGIFIGRAVCRLLPIQLRTNADFYLAPAFGLATLTIVASAIGRIVPMGQTNVSMLVVGILLISIFVCRRDIYKILGHSFIVSIFGVVCGVSILVPLFLYGAFNSHNDAFTYLAHSDWLQGHAFNESVTDDVTALTSQISLYQLQGLRMGGSFLLALVQALSGLSWSYDIYPAVIIVITSVCCLVIGFPIAQRFRGVHKNFILIVIALPAFSLGGVSFSANYGFLPQALGLTLGLGALIIFGFLLQWIVDVNPAWKLILKTALPLSIIFTGAILAYSEILPFMMLAIFGSIFLRSIYFSKSRKSFLIFLTSFLLFSGVLLNGEVFRVYAAIKVQSGVVTGTPVDWSLIGYIAHAFGLHGGAWDILQWASPVSTGGLVNFTLFLSVFVLIIFISFVWRSCFQDFFRKSELIPVVIITTVFLFGIFYFRYFVTSPFQIGVGQSWSQFKLSDWMHPFLMTVFLFCFTGFRSRWGRMSYLLVGALFLVGFFGAISMGVMRMKPFVQYYDNVHNLDKFYIDFRNVVMRACPDKNIPIYLALAGQDLKFRQMATLYLNDRKIISNWTDDGYIYHWLPTEEKNRELEKGNCLVEPVNQEKRLKKSKTIGLFQVGIFE